MLFAKSVGLAGMLLLSIFLAPARGDDAPVLTTDEPLVVLNSYGTGFGNMRARPDPRSDAVAKIPVGALGVSATGKVDRYGDTWWVEAQSGGTTGWLNARLLAHAASGTPLQAYVNIEDYKILTDYEFSEPTSKTLPVTSFEECARRCATDATCKAIDYRRLTAQCGLYDARGAVLKRGSSEIAAKPAPMPLGGWAAQTKGVFDRSTDQAFEADGFREVMAYGVDECAMICSADTGCAAYGYQRKKYLCSLYERPGKLVSRLANDAGIRQSERPSLGAVVVLPPSALTAAAMPKLTEPLVLKPVQPSLPAATFGTRGPVGDYGDMAGVFQRLMTTSARTRSYVMPGINSQGRLTFVPSEPMSADASGMVAIPPGLEGNAYNLAPLFEPADHSVVHLVFYADPGAAPVVLASTVHDTTVSAVAAALKIQQDLDELARLSGLANDPLALLKPMRR